MLSQAKAVCVNINSEYFFTLHKISTVSHYSFPLFSMCVPANVVAATETNSNVTRTAPMDLTTTTNKGQSSVGNVIVPSHVVTAAATNSNAVTVTQIDQTSMTAKTARKKRRSTYTKTSNNVDTEWAESLVGLQLDIPNNWWRGFTGKKIHQGEIVELVKSNKSKECLFSVTVKGDDDNYNMRYDAIFEYANKKQPFYCDYNLPMEPVYLTTPKVSDHDPTIFLWISTPNQRVHALYFLIHRKKKKKLKTQRRQQARLVTEDHDVNNRSDIPLSRPSFLFVLLSLSCLIVYLVKVNQRKPTNE